MFTDVCDLFDNQLGLDVLILDYLLHNATEALLQDQVCFQEETRSKHSAAQPLERLACESRICYGSSSLMTS